MMPKYAKDEANQILPRLDKLARTLQADHKAMGIPFEVAKQIVNAIDATADEIEIGAFGQESFQLRQQQEIAKEAAARKAAQNGRTAEVMHRETDEPYMKSFETNPNTMQIEADEPYMRAYGQPDQSSAVLHGVSTSGRPLTPHKSNSPSPV